MNKPGQPAASMSRATAMSGPLQGAGSIGNLVAASGHRTVIGNQRSSAPNWAVKPRL
jgi:hypothetical protein